MEIKTDHFIKYLTQNHRVVVLGGLAMIVHGLSASTREVEIWLDPMASSHEWASSLEKVCADFVWLSIQRLPGWSPVSGLDNRGRSKAPGSRRVSLEPRDQGAGRSQTAEGTEALSRHAGI